MAVHVKQLSYGSIVRASVSDPNGKNFKLRPLVIIDQSYHFRQDKDLVMACITTTFDRDKTKFVPLPYDNQSPTGHRATGLRIACAVACHWIRCLDAFDVEDVRGYVPESLMEHVLRLVRQNHAGALADPATKIVSANVNPKGQTRNG